MSDLEEKKAVAAEAAAKAAAAKKENKVSDEEKEAKKLAAAEAARKAKEQKEALKAEEQAKKQEELRKQAEAIFNAISSAAEQLKGSLAQINEQSSVEEVYAARDFGANGVKTIKEGLKELKAVVKKSKGEDLSGAVLAATDLIDDVDSIVKGFKDKIKEAKEAEKEAEKARAKAQREAEKEATRMPEQNGVRRPQDETACGRAWALMDKMSAELGQPVPISYMLHLAGRHQLNTDTVKTQYARWKKFNGVTGRVPVPVPEQLKSL